MPLTDDELRSILAKLDDVMRQAQEMSEQVKTRLDDRRNPDKSATNWDRRNHPERRTRLRG
jgi:hypothetical protein